MTGDPTAPVPPADDAYEWFRRGSALLEQGNAAAAAELLAWAADEEPTAHSIRETWARALYDAKRYEEAARQFRVLLELAPDDDYACFGLGLSLWRMRRFPESADYLAMAAVMRPDRAEYASALRQVRATLAARKEAGLDPVGQDGEAMP